MYYSNPQSSNATPKAPLAVATASHQFVKSPLVLIAIIAYTCYAAVSVIQGLPALEYLGTFLEIFDYSFFLGLAMITALFMFVAPIIISCGLWLMYNSDGKRGADTVQNGINTYLGMFIGILSCILLAIVFAGGFSDGLSEFLDELLLPVAYIVFSLVAVASLRKFADSVESTAVCSIAHTYGVSKAGTLIVIHVALTLLAYLDIIDSLDSVGALSMVSDVTDNSLYELASISHMLSLLLFGIAAFVYCDAMGRAKAVDDAQRASTQETSSTGLHVWQCYCGHINPGYCSTCMCGASKHDVVINRAKFTTTQPSTQATEPATPVADHIFCSECGAKCSAQAKFCRTCGAKLI